MKFIYILRDLVAIFLVGTFCFYLFYSLGQNPMELISISLVGLYIYFVHKKNLIITRAAMITLFIWAIIILLGFSGNIINIVFLSLIFLFVIIINVFNPNEKKPKEVISPKNNESTSSNEFVSELKKSVRKNKEFKKSDHNKFMPK